VSGTFKIHTFIKENFYMKKLFLFAYAGWSLTASAQVEKGAMLAGGQMAIKTNKGNSSFVLNPTFGYFIAENTALGAALTLNFTKKGEVQSNNFGLGPFFRYYFGKSQTKPFFVTQVDFLSQTTKTSATKIDATGWGFLIGLGFAAFINDNVAVEGITGYNYADFSNADGSGGFSLSLGIQFYFNRRTVTQLKRNVLGN